MRSAGWLPFASFLHFHLLEDVSLVSSKNRRLGATSEDRGVTGGLAHRRADRLPGMASQSPFRPRTFSRPQSPYNSCEHGETGQREIGGRLEDSELESSKYFSSTRLTGRGRRMRARASPWRAHLGRPARPFGIQPGGRLRSGPPETPISMHENPASVRLSAFAPLSKLLPASLPKETRPVRFRQRSTLGDGFVGGRKAGEAIRRAQWIRCRPRPASQGSFGPKSSWEAMFRGRGRIDLALRSTRLPSG